MSNVITALDHEWRTYDRRPDVKAFLAATATTEPLLVSPTAASLVAEISRVGRSDLRAADDMLRALVRLSVRDRSPIAQRIAMQVLIPGIGGVVIRVGGQHGNPEYDNIVDEIVSLTAVRISSYPIDVRRSGVFFGILRDVERDFRRARARNQTVTLCGRPSDAIPGLPAPIADPSYPGRLRAVEQRLDVVQALGAAAATGMIGQRDLTMIVSTRLLDHHGPTVAATLGCDWRDARRGQQRAERRLAAPLAAYRPSVGIG